MENAINQWAGEQRAGAARRPRVLLVEDHDADAFLIVRELRKSGYDPEVTRVATAEAFLEALRSRQPEIVLSDYSMPLFDGLEALRLLRETGSDLPFILISAAIGEELAASAMRNGAQDYVPKSNLGRLGPAVERELREAEGRRQRREAERKLGLNAALLKQITDQVPGLVFQACVASGSFKAFEFASGGAEALLGVPAARLIAEPSLFMESVFPEDAPEVRTSIEAALATGSKWEHKFRIITFQGSCEWIHGSAVQTESREDGGAVWIGVMMNISAHRQAEDRSQGLEQRLRQAEKLEALGQLAGGVAHDYNNLLTIQFGHINLLKDCFDLPPKARESVEQIEKSAESAATLTRQLLTFSRRQLLEVKRLDINAVLSGLTKMLRRLVREDIGLQLRTGVEPLWIQADAGMMEQVVINLVVNARDAMPQGGYLAVSTEVVTFPDPPPADRPKSRPGAFVCLSVADTGCGMDAATQERVFDPFFTTKAPGKGTGLGLATVDEIVKRHQGWIEIDSAVGLGTTFRVYYPASTEEDSSAQTGGASREMPRGQGETLLLVEDEPAVRKTLSRFLASIGYAVLDAGEIEEAREAWASHREKIRLLITDMVLAQGVNGLDLAHLLRAERPSLPVILISGYSAELVAEGIPEDVGFLPKPCNLPMLAKALRQRLERTEPSED